MCEQIFFGIPLGCNSLYGTPILGTGLKAGVALVLVGMAVEGTMHIEGVSDIDCSYEQLDHTLCLLGVSIQRLLCFPFELTM
jgi:UDP-N-acetylglucosamine 1-carboxyvinyltransferase